MMNDQESAPSAVRLRGETALRQVIGLFKSANGHQTPYEGQLLTSRTACWTWSRRALKAGISVPGPTLARCAAILAETATPETLNATLDTLLATYVRRISPDTQRKTRNCVRTLLAKFGDRAGIYLASMAGPEGMSVFGNDKELAEWITNAKAKSMRAPLSLRQWAVALKDERPDDVETVDEANGWATWVRPQNLPPPVTGRARPTTFYTQNFNGFFKRLREGDFRRLLEDLRDVKHRDPDVIVGSEILGCPMDEKKTRMAKRTLKLMLFALGYTHIAWNWCPSSPEHHGTCVFSKKAWDGIEFGLVDGTTDTEGRTITLYFDGIATICTYHPCSSMDGTRPDKDTARQAYDLAYAAHFKNVQLKCGTNGVFSTGDCNVAPTEQHVTRGQSPWRTPASTKKFERRAYAHLLDVAHLKNAADGTPFQYATTWSSKGETSLAMSIDHTLVPKDDLRVCVYNFEITKRKHNSDHYGQLFTICTRDAMIATLAPSFAPLPGRS